LLTHAGFTVENEIDRRERAIAQLERLLAFPGISSRRSDYR
jgi:hypothetical protein